MSFFNFISNTALFALEWFIFKICELSNCFRRKCEGARQREKASFVKGVSSTGEFKDLYKHKAFL